MLWLGVLLDIHERSSTGDLNADKKHDACPQQRSKESSGSRANQAGQASSRPVSEGEDGKNAEDQNQWTVERDPHAGRHRNSAVADAWQEHAKSCLQHQEADKDENVTNCFH